MDPSSLEVLEFGRLKELLSGFAQTELGREASMRLSPELDQREVGLIYDKLDELSRLGSEPSLSEIEELRGFIHKGVLTPVELLKVLRTIKAMRVIREWFGLKRGEAPRVWADLSELKDLSPLEVRLESSIEPPGQLKDTASPELNRLRRAIRARRGSLIRRLESILAQNPKIFQEPRVRTWDNRFVLPLKEAARSQFSGVVLGGSARGSTLFVEPTEVLDEQNELSELISAERVEVRRVLRALTEEVHARADAIRHNLDIMARLDLLYARLGFGRRFGGVRPEIDPQGRIHIRGGRHPLLVLARSDVVGLDLELAPETRVLLISGPNAGGKTVVLKTVGLFALMLRAGIPIPAASASLPFYSQVFADIGDESSIDRGLSSFSASLLQIGKILAQASEGTLVLLDELGGSTGVEEGAALGMAVLRYLRDRGAQTLAVSHLTPLFLSVEEAEGMMNGAMEFKGRPTYRLLLGRFGRSRGLEMAQQLGFPEELLSEARGYLKEEWVEAARYRERLEEELARVSERSRELAAQLEEVSRLRQEYEGRLAQFSRFQRSEERRLLREQEEFLRAERCRFEALVKELKGSDGARAQIRAGHEHFKAEFDRIRTRMRGLSGVKEELRPGDWVASESLKRQGQVVEVGEEVRVQFGRVKVCLPLEDLVRVQPPVGSPRPSGFGDTPFDPRLSLRGLTQEEAWERLDRFLDMAFFHGAREVWVVHGRGRGMLQRMVWNYLKGDSRVEGFRFGGPGEGGAGVTVVALKSEGGERS